MALRPWQETQHLILIDMHEQEQRIGLFPPRPETSGGVEIDEVGQSVDCWLVRWSAELYGEIQWTV